MYICLEEVRVIIYRVLFTLMDDACDISKFYSSPFTDIKLANIYMDKKSSILYEEGFTSVTSRIVEEMIINNIDDLNKLLKT